MLQRVYVNKKSVPVPVPIQTVEQLVHWVEHTFVKEDQLITKIVLDDQDITDEINQCADQKLDASSKVEVQVDTARDLLLHLIDVFQNLLSMTEKSLKPLAVDLWQYKQRETPAALKQLVKDLTLMSELAEHLVSFLQSTELDYAPIEYVDHLSRQIVPIINSASDYQEVARILLNHLEPKLQEALNQVADIQCALFSIAAEETMLNINQRR